MDADASPGIRETDNRDGAEEKLQLNVVKVDDNGNKPDEQMIQR